QGHGGRRRLRHLPARRGRGRPLQLGVDGARAARRSPDVAGGRHAGQRRGGPAPMLHAVLCRDAQARMESGHPAAHRLLRRVEGSAGRGLRQCLQGAMGTLPAPRSRRREALSLGSARRREGRAARGARPEELAAAQVARRAKAQGIRRDKASMKRDTILTIKLPVAGGRLEEHAVRAPKAFRRPDKPFTRVALAAAHVVADPFSTREPWLEAAIDWDATLAYRRHLWSWGFGVAEAMDTAQRGMGLDWPSSLELVRRSVEMSRDVPGARVASGTGTDHLDGARKHSIEGIVAAYEMQSGAIEKLGGRIILMASRALAAAARTPEDYARVYDRILSQVKEPVIIHWLGEMFDPALAGYWGAADHQAAMDVCLSIIERNRTKVHGI